MYAVSESEDEIRGRLIVADVQAGLPLYSATCNLVTALDLFEHLTDPRPVLKEIRRGFTDTGMGYLKICYSPHPKAPRAPTHINFRPPSYWEQKIEQGEVASPRGYETQFA